MTIELEGRRASLKVAVSETASLQAAIEIAREEVQQLGGTLAELKLRQAEAERTEVFFRSLDRRRTEVGLAQVAVANNVTILDAAIANPAPVRPRILLNALAGLVAGLFGGAAVAMLLEVVDVTVRTSDDVETGIGVPFLGFVPRMDVKQLQKMLADPSRGTVAFALPRSPVAEALRSLRTTLQLASRSKPVNTLLITSTVPLEGKSFVSANLASMVAMAGGPVLLVDADLRRPTAHKMLGKENERGLADLLSGEQDVFRYIRSSAVPGLDLLSAGQASDPAEILNVTRMTEVIETLSRKYALVVVDSSPVGVVADGYLWASIVDATMMVIEAERTRRSHAARTAAELKAANPRMLGAIVNKVALSQTRGQYNYKYYSREAAPRETA